MTLETNEHEVYDNEQTKYLITALPSGDCYSRDKRVKGGGREEDGTDVLILDIWILYIVYCILWVNRHI